VLSKASRPCRCCPPASSGLKPPPGCCAGAPWWARPDGLLRPGELSPAALQHPVRLPAAWLTAVAGSLARRAKEGPRRVCSGQLSPRRLLQWPEGLGSGDLSGEQLQAPLLPPGDTPEAPPGCLRSGPLRRGDQPSVRRSGRLHRLAISLGLTAPVWFGACANVMDLAERRAEALVSAPGMPASRACSCCPPGPGW